MIEPLSSMSTDPSLNLAATFAASTVDEEIDTRFGKVLLKKDRPVTFDKGMLGFPDRHRFCLLNFPVRKFAQFELLQCLDDHQLSFIVLPLGLENQIVDRKDIEEGCKDLNINQGHLALYLVVSVHREMNTVRLSVNARAPLFMHTDTRDAEQYVLRNNKYEVRHMLGSEFLPKKDN